MWNAAYYDNLIKDSQGRRMPYTVDWKDLQAIAEECKATPGRAPTGVTNVLWRQFSSRIIMPGVNANIDLSVWLGTDEAFYAWLGVPSPSIVTPAEWRFLDPLIKDDIAYALAVEHRRFPL
jgi:hypothetical protein